MTDAEAVAMSRHLVLHDGLFLGSSAAVNLVAACRYAKKLSRLGEKKMVVTILWYAAAARVRRFVSLTAHSDSGTRHYSKFWCADSFRSSVGAE